MSDSTQSSISRPVTSRKRNLGHLTAVYTRVSTAQQTTRSQKPDLQRWIDAQNPTELGQVKWYHDSATGKTMDALTKITMPAGVNIGIKT